MFSQVAHVDAKTCTADFGGSEDVMPYANHNLSVADIREKLDYDPMTGIFVWKVAPARNIRAGTEAGCVKACRADKNGDSVSYRYIRIGHEIPAARLAWVIHYGEWPLCKILFEDGDALNLRIDNLREANSLLKKYDHSDPDDRKAYMKAHREAFPRAWKNSHLMASFGITLADYAEMVAAQDNKCAICGNPEVEMRAGKVKALAVDHSHTTGKTRGLLCVACNTGLGKLGDNRETLLAAVRYLDKHSDAQNVVTLKGTT